MTNTTRQSTAPLGRLHTSATHRSLREITNLVRNGDMTLNAPYQRGPVWTMDQRIGLIRSLLLGVPIPAVVINDRNNSDWADGLITMDDPLYSVIDGKQRIETMLLWFDDILAVPASWWDPGDVDITEDTPDGPYVRYGGLSRIARRVFQNYAAIAVVEGKLSTVRAEAEVFCLVNGEGTPVTSTDFDRAGAVAERPLIVEGTESSVRCWADSLG